MPNKNRFWVHLLIVVNLIVVSISSTVTKAQEVDTEAEISNFRTPANDTELRFWLQNMVWHHRFTSEEVQAATGLSSNEIQRSLERFKISSDTRPLREPNAPIHVLPYPGGRHPRIGFLDGAIRPQRETKVSVFTPWDPSSYVVLDVPEAIWSNLGLTYLAHTHIPTIFDKQGQELERLEWHVDREGSLHCERRLPNGIHFGTTIQPRHDHLRMEMWLTNGTDQKLSDLRVQNCAMLKGAKGFDQQTNDNKVFWNSYAACHSESGDQWIILGWQPIHRPWGNAPCPCLHADPKFPDCAPQETQRLRGWFSFFQGTDIHAELRRIEQTGWKDADYLTTFRLPTYPDATAPPARSHSDVAQLLKDSVSAAPPGGDSRPLRIVLVAGPKDHKPGEHDYPAWQQVWRRLLANSSLARVETAWEFPAQEQIDGADVLVFYQRGRWNDERAAAIDPFLARGGGLVYIHWAVDGRGEQAEMAERIGLASLGGQIRFRHGPLDIDFSPGFDHPITRNFERIRWVDESYWSLTGDPTQIRLMGTSLEDGSPQPQFWTVQRGKGRVFVSIPGHYMWTFDDPAFRTLLLRGILWVGHRPVDGFNELVTLDARIENVSR